MRSRGLLEPNVGAIWRSLGRAQTSTPLPIVLLIFSAVWLAGHFLIVSGRPQEWLAWLRGEDDSEVVTFQWHSIAPELGPFINEVRAAP